MKIFLFFFEMAIKITGSAQNYRVGRVSGNTPIFFLGLMLNDQVVPSQLQHCKDVASDNQAQFVIFIVQVFKMLPF